MPEKQKVEKMDARMAAAFGLFEKLLMDCGHRLVCVAILKQDAVTGDAENDSVVGHMKIAWNPNLHETSRLSCIPRLITVLEARDDGQNVD